MARKMMSKRKPTKLVSRRLTRGKRKGQTIQGYVGKNGKFTEARTRGGQRVTSTGTEVGRNKSKTGPRAGKQFTVGTTSSGQKVHRYVINGKVKDVVVGAKKKAKTRGPVGKMAKVSAGKKMSMMKPKM